MSNRLGANYNDGMDVTEELGSVRCKEGLKTFDDDTRSEKSRKVVTIFQSNGLTINAHGPGVDELDHEMRYYRNTPGSSRPRSRRNSEDMALAELDRSYRDTPVSSKPRSRRNSVDIILDDELDYVKKPYRYTPSSSRPQTRKNSGATFLNVNPFSDGEYQVDYDKNSYREMNNSSRPRSRRNSAANSLEVYSCEDCSEYQIPNFIGRTEDKSGREDDVGKVEEGNEEDKNSAVMDDSLFRRRMTIAGGFLDIALFTSNCEQLKTLLEIREKNEFYDAVLGLIIASLILQAVCGMTLFMLGFLIIKNKADKLRGDVLNHITFGLIALITVVNIFISSFAVKEAFIRKCNGLIEEKKAVNPNFSFLQYNP